MKKMKTFYVPCIAITKPIIVDVKAHSLEKAIEKVEEKLCDEGGEAVMGYDWADYPHPEVCTEALKWKSIVELNNV